MTTVTSAVEMVIGSPSATVTSAPSKLSSPTTMSAVRAGSPCGVLAGSVKPPLGSASRRNVRSSRNEMRIAPCSAVRVTLAPSCSTAVTPPRDEPAGSTGTSGVTDFGAIGVVPGPDAAAVADAAAATELAAVAASVVANAGVTPAVARRPTPIRAHALARAVLRCFPGGGVRWRIIVARFHLND